jgi:hypothetical protein
LDLKQGRYAQSKEKNRMTGDGVRFFSFLAVYVGNYVETDKNASEGVLDILCRIPGASYIFYVFFGRIRARAACGVCL